MPRRRIEELLELVGLRERAKDKVSGYSLGMKQRLGIAGALLRDPRLLLLDEPANGLDPAGIVAMRETLRRLAGEGKTVFVSSHLLAEVRVLADVVGIIAAGRLVREGTPRVAAPRAGRGPRAGAAAPTRPRGSRAALERDRAARTAARRRRPTAIRGSPSTSSRIARARSTASSPSAGIFATGLESGTDLELLFLELTGGDAPRPTEGDVRDAAGADAARGGTDAGTDSGALRMRIFVAGLRKLVGRPASFVSVGLLVGLLGLILIASATVGRAATMPGRVRAAPS